tara:strand:- start:179 stop:1567 length:1389 start_codon:yes stop_codon:yes gene_type:complete
MSSSALKSEVVSLNLKDEIFVVFRDSKGNNPLSKYSIYSGKMSERELSEGLKALVGDVSQIGKGIEAAVIRVGDAHVNVKSILNELKVFRVKEIYRQEPTQVIYRETFGKVQVEKERAPSPVAQKSKASRVLIIDDSKTIRNILTRILSSDPELEVIGEAERPSQAMDMIESLKPDVITLDIGLPEMNGVELLKLYMRRFRIPTVMISALSREESPLVLESLEAGAVDYIQKPSFQEIPQLGPVIAEKVRNAGRAKVQVGVPHGSRLVTEMRTDQLLAIGASTGGTEAIKALMMRLPKNIPPTAIVQHIPPVFSAAFAHSLNAICPFEVREAKHGDRLEPNLVLIAPGGFQMRLKKRASYIEVLVEDEAPVNRHKPSVDYMFDSVAEEFKDQAVGVILTGMGADGAKGLLKMKEAGAFTIGQDEDSCVVYGMPRAAADIGAVEKVLPLGKIAEFLTEKMRRV